MPLISKQLNWIKEISTSYAILKKRLRNIR